ncbi:hypothetical protein ANN_03324 [Periplaneta americana]|uniref:Reverse transcriptase domain-containing protein n=1 Tax=Periplaneta americana TaxID=6978 RepID=A0ABQ8U1J9_PERAM|nr:hypothetical protein ANN_03324 [Periplaneta americana]
MIRLSYFPSTWKHANIVMIPKPNKIRTDPFNYRPISLLPLFSKLFERLLLPRLLTHLESLLPNTQFGFRKMHSCPQQLHRIIDIILDTYEKKQICLGLFLDTEKAFDEVWHNGLLFKLKNHLPDTYYRLIQSFLRRRTYSVIYEGVQSQIRYISADVPQGSILAPFLYLIYTHDIPTPKSDSLTVAQFADDIAVLSKGDTGEQVTTNLQNILQEIEKWNKKWRTVMNTNKSSIVTFTYLKKEKALPLYLNCSPVPQHEEV